MMKLERVMHGDETKATPGYIYFIKHMALVKIGYSRSDPKGRLRAIRTAIPEAELLFAIIHTDAAGEEKRLHAKFKNKRRGGEWFDLSEGDLIWIKNTAQILIPPEGLR